jgi:iron uptake system EfeUOB component EfeO/EfeM
MAMLYSNKLDITVSSVQVSTINVCVREVASSGINCEAFVEFDINIPGLASGTATLNNLYCTSGQTCSPMSVNIVNGNGSVIVTLGFNVQSKWQVTYGNISSDIIYVNTDVTGQITSNYMCSPNIQPLASISTSSSSTSLTTNCICK